MNAHPKETELALLAGGDCGVVSRFFLQRHVRGCRVCTAKVAQFELLRADLAGVAVPDVNWEWLSAEMRANIRLGLEAGECVRDAERPRRLNPRLAIAFASMSFLIVAGVMMKSHTVSEQHNIVQKAATTPELLSTSAGLELRDGDSSMMLLNRGGSVAGQTVSAQGEIRALSVQGGAVTINNVSLY